MKVMEMEILTEQEEKILRVTLNGRLDSSNADRICTELLNLLGEKPMLISLAQCSYLSSAGMRTIVVVAKQAQQKGCRICFTDAVKDVHEVLEMTGFLAVIPYAGTRAEAEKRLL